MKQQSFTRLAVFAAVAEQGSFTLAAASLGLPRSSVSRAVAALEEQVGALLFHRTTRRVQLSPAGRTLFSRAAPGLAALDDALRVPLVDADADAGVVRITAVADFAAAVLADAVAAFTLRWPRIRVELVLTQRVLDLRAEGIDVALRFTFGRLRGDGLVARRLGNVSVALFAAPSYLARAGTPRSIDDLRGHRGVVATQLARIQLRSDGARRTLPLPSSIACDDVSTCRALVVAGAGIGCLPAHLVKDDVRSGALLPLLSDWRAAGGSAWLVLPQREVPRRVELFRDFVLGVAATWF